MPIRDSIQNCFRELVISTPYEKITVTSLCRRVNISRAAFYDHFNSKDAILFSLVEHDLYMPNHQMMQSIPTRKLKSAPQILMEMIYQTIQRNSLFYLKLNRIDKGRLLIATLTELFSALNDNVLADFDLPEDEKRYSAFFFAVSDAHLISKWLDNGMDVAPARLAQLYNKWTLRYWFDVNPEKMGWM
ncbi:MAG: TetR/AcrR family transcriptional regulator [Coriobacteriales bacterium]|jgi:AcrR family transcriptional regulator|nr:TetR/AcrR family transcriptional regulator [Coriobacteriales bacterium]